MVGPTDAERATLVALLRTRPQGLSWEQLVAEIIDRGGPRPVWDTLTELSLFDTDQEVDIDRAAADIAEWTASRLGFHTFLDQDYPAQLREIHQLPPVLFSRGTVAAADRAVSVVGSRQASPWGRGWARDVAEALVDSGITVLSGLADGIDTAAHTAALHAGGRTVAVIGTGINRAYPADNKDLQERIAHKGLVLSQFWPDAPPTKSSFPMRNATMSGYGTATVVVEAGERSGTRIQARVAVEHGRPVILTDRVVRAARWAADLQSKPGVHVVATPADVLDVVADLCRDLDDVLVAAMSEGRA